PVRPRRAAGSIKRLATAAAIVAVTGLGGGVYWFKMQGLPIYGQAEPSPATPAETATLRETTPPDPVVVAEKATNAPRPAAPAPKRHTPPAAAATEVTSPPPRAASPRATPAAAPRPTPPAAQVARAAAATVSAAIAPAPPTREAAATQPEPVAAPAPPPP